MAQTKLNNIIAMVSAQIGDTFNYDYTSDEVLKAVNESRAKIYNDMLVAFMQKAESTKEGYRTFMNLYPEWVVTKKFIVSAIANNGASVTCTTTYPHRFVVGDVVYISGAAGFSTNPNGYFTITAVSENTFTVTITVGSGSYTANSATVVHGIVNNVVRKASDVRMVISGVVNAAAPALTNAKADKIPIEVFDEARYNSFSPYYPSTGNVKIAEVDNVIHVMAGSTVIAQGNVALLCLTHPVDAVVNANYNDIPDPYLWTVDIVDLASELLLSYQLT